MTADCQREHAAPLTKGADSVLSVIRCGFTLNYAASIDFGRQSEFGEWRRI
jgi:hypothetical protein